MPRKVWPEVTFKPTPLAFWVSTLTTRPPTSPPPGALIPRAYARLDQETLTLPQWPPLLSICVLCTSVICAVHLHSHIYASAQCMHLPPANNFSNAYIDLNKGEYVLIFTKHPILPRKRVPQVGLKPMPPTFQTSALTTRPLTPPLPRCPHSKGLCKAISGDLDLALTTTAVYICTSHICHLHSRICAMEASTSS